MTSRVNNKYGNKKIIRDGMTFDSAKEYRRYLKLKALERAGEITDLQMQVKFILIPCQREPDTIGVRGGKIKGKLIEKECAYYADFVYKDKHGILCAEDTKGYRGGGAYTVFSIKRKLMLYVHGIRVCEV